MMPARFYRTLPLLGSQPVRPFHPYQPSDWGALQRYARRPKVRGGWQVTWPTMDTSAIYAALGWCDLE